MIPIALQDIEQKDLGVALTACVQTVGKGQMAGTDSTQEAITGGPAIILVVPQLGENIGKAARAMYNFGLTDLRMVAPRDGWPNESAWAPAAGADLVLDQAQIFPTTADAIHDLHYVVATSARPRDMVKPVVTPKKACSELREVSAKGQKCGILFGGEKAGLKNDDVALAHKLISVPVNPSFASINLAQAVLLMSYEWFQTGYEGLEESLDLLGAKPASGEEVVRMFEHLESELDDAGFLYPPEKRPNMVRNIRNMFQRADLTDQDVQTLRGMIKALSRGRPRRG